MHGCLSEMYELERPERLGRLAGVMVKVIWVFGVLVVVVVKVCTKRETAVLLLGPSHPQQHAYRRWLVWACCPRPG